MPFTSDQLTQGAKYALETYNRTTPVDQINFQHAALKWLMDHKKPSIFSNGLYRDPLHIDNDSNTQNYFGADQVTYNQRDPDRWTQFEYYNVHDGFYFDEDTLLASGITITDDGGMVPTADERSQLLKLIDQSYVAMREALQLHLAVEMYRDGTQSTKACPGFESVIDWTPTVGTVGGINAATETYWQNNANLTITNANVVAEMEESFAACVRYGGARPTAFFCGRTFYDNALVYFPQAVQRHQAVGGKGGVNMDPGIEALNFRGIPIIWDPTLDYLDTLLSTSTRGKTLYMVNDKHITLRPVKNNWMVNRKPERLPDRYVHYFGRTAKYGLTTDRRRSLAVMSLT